MVAALDGQHDGEGTGTVEEGVQSWVTDAEEGDEMVVVGEMGVMGVMALMRAH